MRDAIIEPIRQCRSTWRPGSGRPRMTRTVPTYAEVGQKCWEDRPRDMRVNTTRRRLHTCEPCGLPLYHGLSDKLEPPQTPLMPCGTMLIVDSHTHLDWIIAKTGGQPWLVEGVPRHPPGHAWSLPTPVHHL